MKFSRITFTWSTRWAQPARWRLGLFGIYERQSARFGLTDALVISVRGLLVWALALALVGWLAAATVLSRVLAKRPHNTVTWADCALLPLRWETVRMKRGQAYIAEGLDDFRGGRWREGANKISAGLGRNPATREGRRELASFYLAARVRPRALRTLLGGLEHGELDRAYFEDVINTAMQGDDFDVALEACTRAEARWSGDGQSADARWLTERHLVVLVRSGRHEEALRLAESRRLDTPPANEVRVAALIELKRFAEITELLDVWERRAGVTAATLQLRAHALAAEGRSDELGRVLGRLRMMQGDKPGYFVFAAGKWLQSGERAAAVDAFEDFRLRYGGDRRAMEEMGAELAKHADVELLERCLEVAREHGYPARGWQMHLFDACVVGGDWEKARYAAEAIERSGATEPSEQNRRSDQRIRHLMTALTSEADGVQRQLVEACRSQVLPLPMVKFMHAALMRAERYATARDLADFATLGYPGSKFLVEARAAAAERAEAVTTEVAQSRTEEVAAYAAAGAAARKALAEDAMPEAIVAPASEDEFFAALEVAKQAADWSRMVSLITSLRYQRPAWLASRETDLMRIEIAGRQQLGDTPELLVAVRSFLNGTTERSEEILTLAREIDAAGDRSLARAVLAEVVRKSPEFSEAVELLQTWIPEPTDPAANETTDLGAKPESGGKIDTGKRD